ncbi:MAG: hypothetical protein EXS37_16685 [Opitutus sp.]|nr:hypothetical protein [Opitutus sp.]
MAPRESVNSLAWTSDGKRLVYTKETPSKEKKGPAQAAIWSTVIDSGESVKLKFPQPDVSDIAINPDGRQIAYQTGSIGDAVDVWVMDGLIPKPLPQKEGPRPRVIAQSSYAKVQISVAEISGPKHSILDRKFGLSATLPPGWTIKNAGRTDTWGNQIAFIAPDTPDDAKAFVNYRTTKPGELATFHGENWTGTAGPKPTTPSELDAWMRKPAQGLEREPDASYQNYKNRPESFVARMIGEYRVWTWSADYTNYNESWTYYWTLIESGKSGARFQLSVPTAKFDALRPAFDALIESVHLDGTTSIPLDEITGPNSSILDRKFGLSVTYPAAWIISKAERHSDGLNQIALKVPGASHVVMNYRSTTPWEGFNPAALPLKELGPKPTTPTEIDAWLRNYVQTAEQRTQEKVENHGIRAASMISRVVNGHPALSWSRDFEEAGEPRTSYSTLIYGENVIVRFWMGDAVANLEELRAEVERMIETVRLP